jgi:hypothetical protein
MLGLAGIHVLCLRNKESTSTAVTKAKPSFGRLRPAMTREIGQWPTWQTKPERNRSFTND